MDPNNQRQLHPYYIMCDFVFGMRFFPLLHDFIHSIHSNCGKTAEQSKSHTDCYTCKAISFYCYRFCITLYIPFNQNIGFYVCMSAVFIKANAYLMYTQIIKYIGLIAMKVNYKLNKYFPKSVAVHLNFQLKIQINFFD